MGWSTVYDRALVVALRHRRITLIVMILTICATVALFCAIPKGFFPQQDTGMIVGISEGAQDISPQAMMERQQAVLDVVIKDPAVASATAYIGPGGSTVTENDGRMFITLKPHGQRGATADQVIARLNRALQPVQGITLYMQAAQDINVGARLSKTQYQYTLVDVDTAELNHWAPILLQKTAGTAATHRRRQRSAKRRPDAEGRGQPRRRLSPRRRSRGWSIPFFTMLSVSDTWRGSTRP